MFLKSFMALSSEYLWHGEKSKNNRYQTAGTFKPDAVLNPDYPAVGVCFGFVKPGNPN